MLGKLQKLVSDADDIRGGIVEAISSVELSGEIKNARVLTLFLSDTIIVGAWADDPTGCSPREPRMGGTDSRRSHRGEPPLPCR